MSITEMVVALMPHGIWATVVVYGMRLVVASRTLEQASASGSPAESPDIPDDLLALAMSHREPWAQEDTLRVIRERYDDLKNWNRVRAAMNIGVIAQ